MVLNKPANPVEPPIEACPVVETVSLDRLPRGVPAVVSAVHVADEDLARMQAMGVCEGRPIHVMRVGSRMIVCAAGTRIGLDRKLAASVTVTPLPGPPGGPDGPGCGSAATI